MYHLGDRLALYRKQKSLTQQDFADKIDLNRVSLSLIERTGKVSNDILEKICNNFDIPKEWLMSGKGLPPKGIVVTEINTTLSADPWRDALVQQLKEENTRLWALVQAYLPKGPASFLKPLSLAGTRKIQMGVQLGGQFTQAA